MSFLVLGMDACLDFPFSWGGIMKERDVPSEPALAVRPTRCK